MIEKIFRVASYAVLTMAFSLILIAWPSTSDALVKGWTPITEEELSTGNDGDNPLGIVIVPSEENQTVDDQISLGGIDENRYPDLGSDQVFPFVAGLGPN